MDRVLQLAKRNRYGFWAVFDIAYHGHSGPVRIGDIAERQRIHKGYLQQIFQRLKTAGIVEREPGPEGDFAFCASPKRSRFKNSGDTILNY